MQTLFRKLNLSKFDQNELVLRLEEDLNKSDVNLTFRWSQGSKVIFFKLLLKVDNKPSIDILQGQTLKASNGVKTFPIGSFGDKVQLEIDFGVLGFTDVPKAVTLISQDNPIVAFQASPKTPGTTNKINSGSRLEETYKYKVQ